MTSSSSPSALDLEREARILAVSLAEALAASSLPTDQKAAWATLLPEMRLDQLSQFAQVLDASVSQAVRAEIQDVLRDVQKVLDKYAAIQAQADSDFMKGISGIVEDLRRAEGGKGNS